MKDITIELPSIQSLYITMGVNGNPLSTGTGFVALRNGAHYLVTNRHNASGRRSDTNDLLSPTGAVPDTIYVGHNKAGQLGRWVGKPVPVLDPDGAPLWREHPRHGRAVDVVAVPIAPDPEVDLYPIDLDEPSSGLSTRVTTSVQVVGFPFGQAAGGLFAIWTQGTIASEWDVDFNELPCFLIDARTRQGQSGSPVLIYNATGMSALAQGGLALGGVRSEFLGVYSGRINEQSDLGIVWRKSALCDVIDHGVTPTSN
jgi:hypothetical protein